jgi:hypothetical protein
MRPGCPRAAGRVRTERWKCLCSPSSATRDARPPMASSPIPVARSQYLLDLLAQAPDLRKRRGPMAPAGRAAQRRDRGGGRGVEIVRRDQAVGRRTPGRRCWLCWRSPRTCGAKTKGGKAPHLVAAWRTVSARSSARSPWRRIELGPRGAGPVESICQSPPQSSRSTRYTPRATPRRSSSAGRRLSGDPSRATCPPCIGS